MGHILMTAVNAVFPIVLLIALGYFLRWKGLINENFVKTGNKLVFTLCLPCMLFVNVYDIADVGAVPWDIIIYCTVAVTILFLLGMVVAVAATKHNRRRGVIWQCCFRSNFAIIGIPLAGALGGEAAAAVSSLIATLVVPVFNIFAVIALSVFVEEVDNRKPGIKRILLDILKNPLIIAVCIGLVCLGIRALQVRLFGKVVFSLGRDLAFLYSVLEKLKAITTPLALLVLGGQFQFNVVKGMFREIAVGTVSRIVIAPVLGIGAALLLERFTGLVSCGPEALPAMIALFGSPVAISSAVMASQMKNDEQLAAQLVVWTSVGSIATVFLQVCILMLAGLLVV